MLHVATQLVVIALVLGNPPNGQSSSSLKGFQRVSNQNNRSNANEHQIGIDTHQSAFGDKNVRFKGFRNMVPKWGLVVSSNDWKKISELEQMDDVELEQISHDQIEYIADAETMQSLLEDEAIKSNPLPLRVSVDESELRLLANYNNTKLINIKSDPTEGDTSCVMKRAVWIGGQVFAALVFLLIIYMLVVHTIKVNHLKWLH